MWLLFAFGSALFAGLTAILAKCGIRNTDSNVATALRTGVVLIFSWLMVFVVGAQSGIRDISAKVLILLILSGLSTGISWLCYFKALQMGDINKVTPIDKSSTVITMLLAFIFLREEITWLKFVSMILIGIGTYLMIQKKETQEKAEDKKWLLYAVGSAVFASLTSILGKIGIQDVNSNLGTAIRTAVVLVMAWIVVFVTGKQDTVKESAVQVHPDKQGTFGMYLGKKWYRLTAKPEILSDDPVDGLDVSVLQNALLSPVLGIKDPKTDARIDFVGGIRGIGELERRCETDCVLAFSMYPTSIAQLFAVADAGRLMPPKSTWFEPKLRSGLFIHQI